jgi:Ubiquitin carboxyl-terminal hydrolase, family 1
MLRELHSLTAFLTQVQLILSARVSDIYPSREINEYLQGDNSILNNASQSRDITTFLEESEELEIAYRPAVSLGQTARPNDIKYHYVTLVTSDDHKLYELDNERLTLRR